MLAQSFPARDQLLSGAQVASAHSPVEAEPEQAFSRVRQPAPGVETRFPSGAGWVGAQGMTFSAWHTPM